MRLSNFESDLMRLHWIGVRLEVLYNGFYSITTKNEETNWFKNAIREYIIIQLHSFLKVRSSLRTHSKETMFFDECLNPYWKPIHKHKEAIRELRNSFFAHMQEKKPFEKFIEEIIITHQFPNYFGEILFLAGCAYLYFNSFRNYFKKEYELATKKYKVLRPVMTPFRTITETKVPKMLDIAQKQTNENIKNDLDHLISFGRISGIEELKSKIDLKEQ